jgi:DNA-binding ferritin-like protein
LLDEHSEQIFAMTDEIAERARKIGGRTLRSISDISRHQRLKDNNDESVASEEMLAELNADNSVTAEVASSSLVVPAILSKAVRRNSLRPLRSRRIFEYRHVE